MVDLILRPTGLSNKPQVRWALQLRYHDCCGETDYATIARVSDPTAREIVRAGAPYWLFGDQEPHDWKVMLEQLEPEEMSVDQMRLEIVRLRQELRDGKTS